MNRIEKVSIGGISFILDEDAYSELNQFLGELESESVEERLAELLVGQLGGSQIVTREMAEAAMAALGRPVKTKERKRLYRDIDHRVLGGVCSGLAARFGIDPVILRIVWVAVFFLGSCFWMRGSFTGIQSFAILLYIILWICMPAAKSAKLNYELGKTATRRSEGGQTLGKLLRIFIGVILMIIGASGILTGVVVLMGSTLFGFGAVLLDWKDALTDVLPAIAPLSKLAWVNILAAFVAFLPFVGMLYGGVMMTFNLKAPKWHPGLVIAAVWLILLILLTTTAISSMLPLGAGSYL